MRTKDFADVLSFKLPYSHDYYFDCFDNESENWGLNYAVHIKEWHIDEGNFVQAGDPIFTIEPGVSKPITGPKILSPVTGKILKLRKSDVIRDLLNENFISIGVNEPRGSYSEKVLNQIMVSEVVSRREMLKRIGLRDRGVKYFALAFIPIAIVFWLFIFGFFKS